MSYDQRLDAAIRPNIYRMPADPVRQIAKNELDVTGIEKSTALSELDTAHTRISGPDDRITFPLPSSSGDHPQGQQLSFSDLLDVINPLQHIPVVSNVYRAVTGDEISNSARVAGSALYFGWLGAAASVANIAMEEITGKDMGDHVVALLSDDTPENGNPYPEDIIDTDASSQTQASSALGSATNSSSGADSASNPTTGQESLSPDQPFSFFPVQTSSIPEVPRTIGFAPSSEPISIESLPADILAALYSGQPVKSAKQGPENNGADNLGAANRSAGETEKPHALDAAPRWSLWSSPDDMVSSHSRAARAYGGVVPDEPASAGSIASQGGWFGANMPEVLARYHDTASLQKQATRPFVDVSQ